MFNVNQIIEKLSKFKAKCKCAQCSKEYICNPYDAARSKIGHLCKECKTQVSGLIEFTRKDLLRVIDYCPISGQLSYKNDSISGTKGEIASYPHSQGYLSIAIGRNEYLVHRVIWFMQTGYWPDQVDHLNHDRSDNRWENLREVGSRENQLNMTRNRKNNSTGVLGVRELPSGRFNATIMVNRKQISLGTYETLEEAAAVRKMAEQSYGFHVNHGS